MENKNIEELEKEYVKTIKDIRLNMIANDSFSDVEIQKRISETPEIIKLRDRSCDANLFLYAVLYNRIELAKYLAEHGADIHFATTSDQFHGNALNGAVTPEMAEWLLSLGLIIERNLIQNINDRPVPYDNPAVVSALRSRSQMMRYWLMKEKELFADDSDYIDELFFTTINMASLSNSSSMLTPIIADDELFSYLKRVYAEGDCWNLKETIKLNKRGLRSVEAEELQDRKKELNKILNQRAKEL